ncbi:MAG TPA: DegQ family serine endoprotease [Thermohalobaculum sp.]|nr:DegQ family serine endoprotease [Thermohalobaculum sp.]
MQRSRAGFRSTGFIGGIVGAALVALAFVGVGPQPAPAQSTLPGFADLAERLSPAVVNISTSQTVDRPEGMPELPPGSPFEDLFRDFFDRDIPQGPQTLESLGSGFVVSPEGYVVSNNHVIEQADEVTVNFSDGSSLLAEVIGRDAKTDIALLKVEPDEALPFVEWGDSNTSRVGDWVLAIGNPFGLGGSVSAGIISALSRDIQAGPYDDFIQTDAAINRGNSGGPLFNLNGRVIGVNTAIISPTGGSIGIGFAVPSALARNVVDQLQEFGVTRRGWLGVRIQQVDDDMAEALQMDRAMGALVADVTPDSPAADAGIEAGDVIVKFDGRDVAEMRDLPRMVAETAVEQTVRVIVFRDGKTRTLPVKIGLLEEATADGMAEPEDAGEGEPDADEPGTAVVLGMTLSPLSGADRERYDISDDVSGVLVAGVEQGSPAVEKGIREGSLIVEVGQEPVSSPAEVAEGVEAARENGRKSVLLLIRSGEDLRFVPLPLGDDGAE